MERYSLRIPVLYVLSCIFMFFVVFCKPLIIRYACLDIGLNLQSVIAFADIVYRLFR